MAIITDTTPSSTRKLTLSNLYWGWSSPAVHAQVGDGDGYFEPSTSIPNWEHVSLVPILATILLIATVFLLVVFRQSPALVAGIINRDICKQILSILYRLDSLSKLLHKILLILYVYLCISFISILVSNSLTIHEYHEYLPTTKPSGYIVRKCVVIAYRLVGIGIMPQSAFLNFISMKKNKQNQPKAVEDVTNTNRQLPRRLSSSKSGKLRTKKEFHVQNIIDDKTYVNPKSVPVQAGLKEIIPSDSNKSNQTSEYTLYTKKENEEDFGLDEVIREMFEISSSPE